MVDKAYKLLVRSIVLMLCIYAGMNGFATEYFSGTHVASLDGVDDSSAGPFAIGFDFTYFGQTYNQFYVTTNGLVTFGSSTSQYTNAALPRSYTHGTLFGFWDDLMSYGSNQPILYRKIDASEPGNTTGRTLLVVHWTNYGFYASTLPMGTFQIILVQGTNEIRYNYFQLLSERSSGNSATIGIQAPNGGTSYQYSSHTDTVGSTTVYPDGLSSGQSIVYTPNGSTYTSTTPSSSTFLDLLLYKDSPPPGSIPSNSADPTDNATDVSMTPTLSWAPAADADSYRIVVSTQANLTSPTVNQSGLTDTSYDVTTPLNPGTQYYWAVVAENAGGQTWSEVQSFTTTTQVNRAPTDVVLNNAAINQSAGVNASVGSLSAQDPDTGDTHTFALVSGASSTDNGLFNLSGNSLRANDAGLLAAGSYSVRVRTSDGGGLFFEKSLTVTVTDDVAPAVTSVMPPSAGGYTLGDTLDFTVAYNEAVTVDTTGGTPRLELSLGTGVVYADYLSGSGSSNLVFRYTVQEGDLGETLILSPTVSLNGGTIRDTVGNSAVATLTGVNTNGIVVDGVQPVVQTVTSGPSGTYGVGQQLDFTVTLSETVVVDTGGGTPRLELTVGNETRYASYVSGAGSDTLVFRYTVQEGDIDADGVTLGTSIEMNGGSVYDSLGNTLAPTLQGIGSTAATLVDGILPTVQSVTAPSEGAFGIGQPLEFTVTFDEAVTVDTTGGVPFLPLMMGDAVRQVSYVAGSGSNSLVFSYTVQEGDTGGFTLGAIELNGGSIHDPADNGAVVGLNDVDDLSGIVIDGVAPRITEVQLPSDGTYVAGQALSFSLKLNKAVVLTGSPFIELTVGSETRQAVYVAGSGSDVLTFEYVVQEGDLSEGVTLGAALNLNGATLKDEVGNDARTDLNAGSTAGILIDAVKPSVALVTAPAPGLYGIGQALEFTVELSETVSVDTTNGLPTLEIDVGDTPRIAEYVAGSDSSVLTFRYIIQEGDPQGNVSVLSSEIALNDAVVGDAAGNPLTVALNNVASTEGVIISGSRPTVQSISLVENGAANTSSVTFSIVFSEAVTGVSLDDFVLTTTGSAAGTITGLTGAGTTYTVTVENLSGTGSVQLDLGITNADIMNSAANLLTEPFVTGQAHAVDRDTPLVAAVALAEEGPFKLDDEIVFNVNMSEAVAVTGTPTLTFYIDGQSFNATLDSERGTETDLVFVYKVLSTDEISGSLTVTAFGLENGALLDLSGNSFAPASFGEVDLGSVLVKGVVPEEPTEVTLALEGSATNDDTLTASGKGQPGTIITVISDIDGPLGTVVVDAEGNWSLDITFQSEGEHVLTVTATDEAGNVTAQSGEAEIEFDQTAPAAPTDVTPSTEGPSSETEVTLSGKAEPGTTITVYSDLDGTLGTVTVDPEGNWELVVTLTTEGAHELTTVATDAAGNQSSDSTPVVVDLILTNPLAPQVTVFPKGSTNQAQQVFAGTAQPDMKIALSSDRDGSLGTVVAGNDGSWRTTVTFSSEGVHQVSAVAVNAAGLLSPPSQTISVILDISAPVLEEIYLRNETRTLKAGQVLTLDLSFNENVTVTSTSPLPKLIFKIGNDEREADFVTTSSGTDLRFEYTVKADEHLTGVLVVTGLNLGESGVTDFVGNAFVAEQMGTWTLDKVAAGEKPVQQVVSGPNSPTVDEPVTLEADAKDTSVLQFTLMRSGGAEPLVVQSVTVRVEVQGNELDAIVGSQASLEGVSAIHLVQDLNGNGQVDAEDTRLATATQLDANHETVTFVLSQPLVVEDESVMLLVSIDGEE